MAAMLLLEERRAMHCNCLTLVCYPPANPAPAPHPLTPLSLPPVSLVPLSHSVSWWRRCSRRRHTAGGSRVTQGGPSSPQILTTFCR